MSKKIIKISSIIIATILIVLSLSITKSHAFEISDSTIMDLSEDHPSESNIYCKEYGGLLCKATGYSESITGSTSTDDGGSGAAASASAAGTAAEGIPGTLNALYTQPQGSVTNTVANQNNSVAYILSSGPNNSLSKYVQSIGGSNDNYKIALSDSANGKAKQRALWSDRTFNEGTILTSNLYNESVEYVNYYNSVFENGKKFSDNTSIDCEHAQVIALQDTQEYILGPYTITYPDNSKFSIMDSMYLSYSDSTGTHKAYLTKSEIIQDGNDTYPHSGHPFYIRVKASKIGYATQVKLGAQFAFIKYASASYDRWQVIAKNIRYSSPTISIINSYPQWDSYTTTDEDGNSYTEWYISYYHYVYQATVYAMLYDQKEQTLSQAKGDDIRQFDNYDIINKSKPTDLTMNMGGRVWKDAKANDKDSGINGLFDTQYNAGVLDEYKDELMPNVTVTLYKQGETTPYKQNGLSENPTKTDNKGTYEFKGLNSMYKYYVKYTYNGQYYQPTKYFVNGKNGWALNSKGMDVSTERNTYNNQYTEIGASPHNYRRSDGTYNKTFSKEYLLGYRLQSDGKYRLTSTPIIDKFGNLIKDTSNDDEERQMINYVKDCRMNAYTCNGSSTKICYPLENEFIISDHQERIAVSHGVPANVKVLYPRDGSYPSNYRIDLGLAEREKADLALRKDVYKATTTINGKTETYNYNKRQALNTNSNGDEYWEISTRVSDANYYNLTYTRQVYPADYNYYNNNDGHSADKNLNIYVTYKITVRNQSGTINGKLTEIVDYYDQVGYTFMNSNTNYAPYVGDINGNPRNDATVTTRDNNSIRYPGTEKNIPGYANEYVDIQGNNQININSDMYIYLTFKVNKKPQEDAVLLDDNDVGKENITEINGYQTTYSDKTVSPNTGNQSANGQEYHAGMNAGLVDVDSNPGNLDSSDVQKNGRVDYTKFEDDTDKAPNIKILLYQNNRDLDGTTWEDKRNVSSSLTKFAQVGNGIRDGNETLIPGITVKLWDTDRNKVSMIWNGSSWKEATTTTQSDGTYKFIGYVPGNYIVKFTYGDTDVTKKYNGQDYKSTTYYQEPGFDVNNPDNSDQYDLQQADGDTQKMSYKSDARDLMTTKIEDSDGTREDVDKYSNNNGQGNVANGLAQKLWDAQNQLDTKLTMTAKSAKIDAEIEYGRTTSNISDNQDNNVIGGSYNSNINTANYTNGGAYNIQNLDFGLEERPKAQLKTTKQVVNVKVILANGNTLFDASKSATNILWVGHTAHGPDGDNSYTSDVNYNYQENNEMYDKKPTNLMQYPIVRKIADKKNKGKIQLTMDEELMHGATIKVTYAIFVANVGEADYKENQFYYTGTVGNEDNIVKTVPNAIIDYVGYQLTDDSNATRNNLKFDPNDADNKGWSIISTDDLNSLNKDVRDKANKNYNTIITNNLLDPNTQQSKALKPIIADQDNAKQIKDILAGNTNGKLPVDAVNFAQDNTQSVAATKLVLSQVLSSENKSDDMTYNNMTEIIKTSNDVGRRMAASVVGNQDPTTEPTEIDADDAQEITILPPFGQHYIYYILGAGIAIILVAGIIIIKKKVLKK